ncbi:hypothetical protein TREMEDRAFT_43442 [Tremella mesenterica DSM 1558]|uniref:uncharacterized protein n=1 Tax=Tremella mesenterica (strain ATCC 24925 / CBS 8224 / DSM 1558 / NBRC 9311 / NRRL Y-6157 / RJB 2259-6 / UBC 559-6) TaxID=578456 RepID=UPI0003F4903D|nr:uncharacterized protein TREMEDRAFT_43442 [Tremella mesenterica DSM 1558]EIW70902.1 hypothetical protein TREMEDRAFT_43442 [Tremella mesenterica DSM 1558]
MFKNLPAFRSLPSAIGLPFLSSSEDAQLKFRSGDNGIKRLYSDEVISVNDVEYWSQFYRLFNSVADVYSLISIQDVRQTLANQPTNLSNLILFLSHHLFTLLPSPMFPSSGGGDTNRQALNCLRVLGRILVVIYESEADFRQSILNSSSSSETFAQKYLWNRPIVKDERDFTDPSGIQEDEGSGNGREERLEDDQFQIGDLDEDELDEGLFTCTVDLLFCAGFTVPESVKGDSGHGDKINYVIWERGIGSTTSLGNHPELDKNKTEVLRFLLILLSSTIYTPPNSLSTSTNLPLEDLTHTLERRLVLSLLCSWLNVSLTPTKAIGGMTGQMPYSHLISKAAEEKRVLVKSCMMTLLVALDYERPELSSMNEGKDENAFRYFVSKLHRKEDFSFILGGILTILEEHAAVTNMYLPGSKKPVPYILETYMLLWRMIDLNKRFRVHLFDSGKALDVVVHILLTCLDLKDDPSQHGLLRLLSYLLQTLSADRAFATALNQTIRMNVPAKWAVQGTAADFMIVSIYSIATTPGLNPLFPALTISISNVAPFLTRIGVQASTRLMQLFKAFSAPNFLLADEGHPRLVYYLLETFNSVLYYQLKENPNLIYAILRSHQDFQTLATFTLVSGLRDIQRRKALRASVATIHPDSSVTSRVDTTESTRRESEISNAAPRSRRESEISISIPESRRESEVLNSGPESRRESVSSRRIIISTTEPEEVSNIGGMSEKARGKMRAVESDKGEEELADEELLKVAMAGVGPNGYVPTQEWVASWQKGLPLDPVLVAISELLPKIQDSTPKAGAPSQKLLDTLKNATLIDVLPPAPPIVPRKFQWSPASCIWLTSLLWGDIYVAGLSPVGVWRDTTVRLFGVKQAPVRGRGAQMGRVLKMIGVV